MYANWTDDEIDAEIHRLEREVSRRQHKPVRTVHVEVDVRIKVSDYFHVIRPNVRVQMDIAVLIDAMAICGD